jgi:hypothetical protein
MDPPADLHLAAGGARAARNQQGACNRAPNSSHENPISHYFPLF